MACDIQWPYSEHISTLICDYSSPYPLYSRNFSSFTFFLLWVNYIIPSTLRAIPPFKRRWHLYRFSSCYPLHESFSYSTLCFQMTDEELLILFYILLLNIVAMSSWIYFPYDYIPLKQQIRYWHINYCILRSFMQNVFYLVFSQ